MSSAQSKYGHVRRYCDHWLTHLTFCTVYSSGGDCRQCVFTNTHSLLRKNGYCSSWARASHWSCVLVISAVSSSSPLCSPARPGAAQCLLMGMASLFSHLSRSLLSSVYLTCVSCYGKPSLMTLVLSQPSLPNNSHAVPRTEAPHSMTSLWAVISGGPELNCLVLEGEALSHEHPHVRNANLRRKEKEGARGK